MRVIENINMLTRSIIGAGIEVHRQLGPTLIESVYSRCLQKELTVCGLSYERERLVPIIYRGETVEGCYRVDLIVEGRVVVELKAVEHVLPVHEAQVLTYLRLTGCPLGLLMNFKVPKLTDGITRLINPQRHTYTGGELDSKI